MKRTVQRIVTVTLKDLSEGLPHSPYRDALCLALQRAFPEARYVKVTPNELELNFNTTSPHRLDYIARLPVEEHMRAWIALYDQRGTAPVMSFGIAISEDFFPPGVLK